MMLNKTFHLILISLIPLLGFSQANTQYSNTKNKIRLGYQTTGDGLIWRDTQPKVGGYQPINNNAAWIILDTVNNKFYHYKNSTWTLAGGQDIDTANLIATKYDLGSKLSLADTGNILTPYWRSGRFTGVLPVANGGTNLTTFTAANRIPYSSSATSLTTSSNLTYNNSTLVVGNENDNYDNLSLKNKATTNNTNRRVGLTANTYEGDSLVGIMSVFATESVRSLVFGGGVSNLKNPTDIIFYTSANVENPLDRGSRHRMYINDIGNIGLGTLSPSQKLHVVGNGLFTDTVRIEDAIKVGANNAYVYSAGTGNYYFTKNYKNQSGLYHIAIGDGVLSNASTVSNPTSSRHGSVAIGFDNLKNLTQSSNTSQGVFNTSIGYNNMVSVTTGAFNTSIGALSLKSLTTGISNVAIGTTTLENMTTGGSNLGIGDGALRFITTGDNNVGIGSNAGIFDAINNQQVTDLNNSIYIGQRADPSGITGVINEIAIGYLAKGQGSNSVTFGNTNTTKTILNGNVGIGTALPIYKLDVNGTARFLDSIFLGNVIIGKTKQNNNSIRFGINAGLSTADKNVAIGTSALQNDVGGENVAIGFDAGKSITTGVRNMLLGSYAGANITTGGSNVAIGSTALFLLTGADGENTAIGRASLEQGTEGYGNTGVGSNTLFRTTGDYNTAVGYWAGWVSSSANFLTGTNNTFIGNNAVGESLTTSNHITLGNSSITKLRCAVNVSTFSDGRDKTDILPLNYGMNFIEKLKPVSFVWDMRDGGKIGIPEIGFIAQDLQQAQIDTGINVPNLVSGSEEKLDVTYNTLLPIIVKALQEANEKIKSLEQKLLILENK